MRSDAPQSGHHNHGPARADLVAAALCAALAVWMHRYALTVFFSSPDDLVHLQQAAGLRPILPTPFRFLAQVVYFKCMLGLFGPTPFVFHLFSLAVHGLNVVLVFALLRNCDLPRTVAVSTAAGFGVFPLFVPLMVSAVGMNDELAMTGALLMLHAWRRPGRAGLLLTSGFFILALLCKESVLAMTLTGLALPRTPRRRVILPGAIALIFGVLLLTLPPQGLGPYAVAFGSNIFHTVMTFTAWALNISRPIPDLVSSFDPAAWKQALWIYPLLAVLAALHRPSRPIMVFGLAWWGAGLLPVMPLKYQTFRHYLYPALPGLFLCLSWGLYTVAMRVHVRWAPHLLSVLVVLYALQSNALVHQRLAAKVTTTPLALDPVLRRQQVAGNAVGSLLESAPRDLARLTIFTPSGLGHVFGARSGKEYTEPHAVPRYDLLQESLDHGRALRLFFPYLANVRFAAAWTPADTSSALALPSIDGTLYYAGGGGDGCVRAALWMLHEGLFTQTKGFMDTAIVIYPAVPRLRIARAHALNQLGQRQAAVDELRHLVQDWPGTADAQAAREILDSWQ